jgi:hypothetical protein
MFCNLKRLKIAPVPNDSGLFDPSRNLLDRIGSKLDRSV